MSKCTHPLSEDIPLKQCNYIVSNYILPKMQFRGHIETDIFKSLGKYSMNKRVATINIRSIMYPTDRVNQLIVAVANEITTIKATKSRNEPIEIKESWQKLYDIEELLERLKDGRETCNDTCNDTGDTGDTTIDNSVYNERLILLENKLKDFARIVMEGFQSMPNP